MDQHLHFSICKSKSEHKNQSMPLSQSALSKQVLFGPFGTVWVLKRKNKELEECAAAVLEKVNGERREKPTQKPITPYLLNMQLSLLWIKSQIKPLYSNHRHTPHGVKTQKKLYCKPLILQTESTVNANSSIHGIITNSLIYLVFYLSDTDLWDCVTNKSGVQSKLDINM